MEAGGSGAGEKEVMLMKLAENGCASTGICAVDGVQPSSSFLPLGHRCRKATARCSTPALVSDKLTVMYLC